MHNKAVKVINRAAGLRVRLGAARCARRHRSWTDVTVQMSGFQRTRQSDVINAPSPLTVRSRRSDSPASEKSLEEVGSLKLQGARPVSCTAMYSDLFKPNHKNELSDKKHQKLQKKS